METATEPSDRVDNKDRLTTIAPELFKEILLYAVSSKKLKTNLGLQLVCRKLAVLLCSGRISRTVGEGVSLLTRLFVAERFRQEVKAAIFRSKYLEEWSFWAPYQGRYRWPCKLDRRVNTGNQQHFRHDYIVYRVRGARDHEVGVYSQIRRTVEYLRDETIGMRGGIPVFDYDHTLSMLCWLHLDPWVEEVEHNSPPKDDESDDDDPTMPGVKSNLLSAAVFLDHRELAKRLLRDGVCPVKMFETFPSPFATAAVANNLEMIQLIQDHIHDGDSRKLGFDPLLVLDEWVDNDPDDLFVHGAIGVAVRRNDLGLLKVLMEPKPTPYELPNRRLPSEFDLYEYGAVECCSRTGMYLIGAITGSRDMHIREYLRKALTPSVDHEDHGDFNGVTTRAWLLIRLIREGDVTDVRNLLDAEPDLSPDFVTCQCYPCLDRDVDQNKACFGCIDRYEYDIGVPLAMAARCGKQDIFALLIERGLHHPNRSRYGTPQSQLGIAFWLAPRSGNLTIIQKLYDLGAATSWKDGFYTYAIRDCLDCENTKLLEFLVDREPTKDKRQVKAWFSDAYMTRRQFWSRLLERSAGRWYERKAVDILRQKAVS
jgi:hypothetical protein